MSVTVQFLGVMLYVGWGEELQRILMPNASSTSKWAKTVSAEKLEHPDGTQAHPHYAGVVVERGGDELTVDRRNLRRHRRLHIGPVGDHAPSPAWLTSAQRVGVPDLSSHALKSSIPADAVQITFSGDPTATRFAPHDKWGFSFNTTSFPLVYGLDVRFSQDEVAIWLPGDPALNLVVRDGDNAIVYQYHKPLPTVASLRARNRPECEPGKPTITDDDFKWLYSLFASTPPYDAPIADCAGLPSPPSPSHGGSGHGDAGQHGGTAPSASSAPRLPFTSTCFGAMYWSP